MPLHAEDFKDFGFTIRKDHVQPDTRGRVALGPTLSNPDYRVLVNDAGQILLDPIVSIPASEAWMWENPALRESMNRALEQAAQGDFHDLGSFAGYADEEDQDS
jgi:hypothetical protein